MLRYFDFPKAQRKNEGKREKNRRPTETKRRPSETNRAHLHLWLRLACWGTRGTWLCNPCARRTTKSVEWPGRESVAPSHRLGAILQTANNTGTSHAAYKIARRRLACGQRSGEGQKCIWATRKMRFQKSFQKKCKEAKFSKNASFQR